jgi:hypothetical protein
MEALERKFLKSAMNNLQNATRKPQLGNLNDYINFINTLQKSIIDCVNLVNTLTDDPDAANKGGITLG